MNVRLIHLPHRLDTTRIGEGASGPLVAELQHILATRGHYNGEIHGRFDAETRAALARFQEEQGLPVTGELTPLTFCRLQAAEKISVDPAPQPPARGKSSLSRPHILITKTKRQLTLFESNTPFRQWPVAIGKPHTPTPVGNFAIAAKIMNPGGVLGTRWMGLNHDSYGIHGTNAPWLIGQMVSNGCIRMHNPHAEELFALIFVGTPVYIRD